MSITRDEIRALCTEADRWLAEERDWLARRQVEAGSPVNESDNDAGLVFKTIDNATVEPAQPEQDWSDWERWMSGHLANFKEELFDGIAEFAVRLLAEERVVYDRRLAELRAENIELKGILATTLRQLNQTAAAEIVDLSIRRRSDAA